MSQLTEEFIRGNLGIWPLDSPGLPAIGPDFLLNAVQEGDGSQVVTTKATKTKAATMTVTAGPVLEDSLRRVLREPRFAAAVTVRPGVREPVNYLPGHIWGQHIKAFCKDVTTAPRVDGPHLASVMVIGKRPEAQEINDGRLMVGATGEIFNGILQQLHFKGTKKWYVTNLVKFVPPDDAKTLRTEWVKDGQYLLHHELRLVQPDYILCLGAEASKALLGKEYNVARMDGRVVDFTYNIGLPGDWAAKKTALVMTVLHPVNVLRDQAQKRQLERGLERFKMLTDGIRFDQAEQDIDHRVVDNLADLEALLAEIDSDPRKTDTVIACDAEWHGAHPCNAGSYLRTFQFAWLPKHAACVTFRGQGGKVAFRDADGKPAIKRAITRLMTWFQNKRVVGHFFNADLEWLVAAGLDLRPQFAVPRFDAEDGTSAWARTRTEGGADTGLMAHAIEETSLYGLEVLTSRYTTAPRYDLPLQDWCSEQKEKFGVLEGYGDAPDDLLIPYSIYDADVTIRIFYALDALLDCDYESNCCREAFWESMLAAPAVLEIHQNGIDVDKARVDSLSEIFVAGRLGLEQRIREWSAWPEFNIRSVYHVRELLYGEKFNGKLEKVTGKSVRIRPPEAQSLGVEPILDTSKPPKLWAELVAKEKTAGKTPGTGKSVLALLAQENEAWADQINMLRDFRFLDQVLKSVLNPPKADADGCLLRDEDGLVYDKGLGACLCDDGKVRTHIYQTKETGRWSSARPPLQNISKSRDPDYSRLLGDRYQQKLRSILRASPGHVLIEADYTGAELFGMAVSARDSQMLAHALRANNPDEGYDAHGKPCPGGKYPHPDYYDIHSNIAVLAFRLDCAPTKAGLASIGKSHFRTLAKNVVFGAAYGRGAKSIALAAREARKKGEPLITLEDAQHTIDAIFELYPQLPAFFEECKRRASEERWLCNCFGRFRRFPYSRDQKMIADFERQAMNFPIQGMIASAVSRAMSHLYHFRAEVGCPDLYRILLQIHDAALLEVPYKHVAYVVDTVIPYCMRDRVPIYPTGLDGVPTGAGPYYLGYGVEVAEHWGEQLTLDRCRELGIPERFGHAA